MCHIYHTRTYYNTLFVSRSYKGLYTFAEKQKYTFTSSQFIYSVRVIFTLVSCCLSDYGLTILIVLTWIGSQVHIYNKLCTQIVLLLSSTLCSKGMQYNQVTYSYFTYDTSRVHFKQIVCSCVYNKNEGVHFSTCVCILADGKAKKYVQIQCTTIKVINSIR